MLSVQIYTHAAYRYTGGMDRTDNDDDEEKIRLVKCLFFSRIHGSND